MKCPETKQSKTQESKENLKEKKKEKKKRKISYLCLKMSRVIATFLQKP